MAIERVVESFHEYGRRTFLKNFDPASIIIGKE